MSLEPGQVVMLKSGGSPMTIVAVDGTDVACVWIGEEGELFRASLPAVALDLIDMSTEAEEEEE